MIVLQVSAGSAIGRSRSDRSAFRVRRCACSSAVGRTAPGTARSSTPGERTLSGTESIERPGVSIVLSPLGIPWLAAVAFRGGPDHADRVIHSVPLLPAL